MFIAGDMRSFFGLFVIMFLFMGSLPSYGQESSGSSKQGRAAVNNAEGGKQAKKDKEPGAVIINDLTLSEAQIREIEETYGVRPAAGRYWYDSTSGLYGAAGYQSYGFMLPGHDYGKLNERASNGDTGVYVNGRELPQAEWIVWSQILGYYIQQGSYWLDQSGNAGYAGVPYPLVNLYSAALQNSYGTGGSGDNFWSSRFSAGNSNAGNTQGYVSVPGYGPVG